MSMLRYVRTLFLFILLLPRRGQPSPIPSLEVSKDLGMADVSLLEQEDNVDLQALLGQLLYRLNSTEQAPKPRAWAGRIQPPEYMLELYNHYAKDPSSRPAANIARSFKNEDSSPYSVTSRGVKAISLMFNVSVPRHEQIIGAELRLYMLVHRDPHRNNGVDWKVTVSERHVEGSAVPQHLEGGPGELVVRHCQLTENRWEAFDLTDAVLRWRDLESTSHWLEVQVESEDKSTLQDEDESDISINLDIERGLGGKHEPVLIVFSENGSDKGRTNKTIPEDNTSLAYVHELLVDEKENAEERENEGLSMQMRSNLIFDSAPRTRRNAKGSQCKRAALYVDFKDIGWDSWIVAPPGFEAYTCHGECDYPLLPQMTPTKHAIIQTLLNLKSPQKVSGACCVPTKLEPISLLYENKNGHVIFQHKYEGMVVAECGCR